MKIKRGEIWLVDLEPTRGCEMKKTRPAVVVSRTDYNLVSGSVVVVPITSGYFDYGIHEPISALKQGSHAVVPQIRVSTKERFKKKLGKVTSGEAEAIGNKLAFLLDLIYL